MGEDYQNKQTKNLKKYYLLIKQIKQILHLNKDLYLPLNKVIWVVQLPVNKGNECTFVQFSFLKTAKCLWRFKENKTYNKN